MKKFKSFVMIAVTAAVGFTGCKEDAPPTTPPSGNEVKKSGLITTDETWTSDKIYILNGRVTVSGGATLTIEPGTIIKGNPGTGAISSALLISREGKIMAEGTAAKPIIFTSIADNIKVGETVSPNMDAENNGLWGGVIILGKAPISASASEVQIEGIPSSDLNGLYGGTEANHNSGVFQYVSIRHGGTLIGSGNEINGLTLGGVGSGTVINNIEIVANQDDGIEWFGGTVDVQNLLIWNCGDDALDTDQDWTGTVSNFIVVNPGDRAMELDGPEGSSFSGNNFSITNGTVYMGSGSELIDFDDNTNADISNVYFYGLSAGQIVTGYAGYMAANTGTVSNIEATLGSAILADVFGGMATVVSSVNANANTVGPTTDSDFAWTWASESGALATIGL